MWIWRGSCGSSGHAVRPRGTPSAHYAARVKTRLICPCGTQVDGQDEDDLVARTQEHLAAEHPGREYDRDMILFMAT